MQRSRTTNKSTILLSDAARRNQRLLNVRRYNASDRLHARSYENLSYRPSAYVPTNGRYSSVSSYQARSSRPVSAFYSADIGGNRDYSHQKTDTTCDSAEKEGKQAGGTANNVKDKHDYLAADFDDFESKMKSTKQKMKSLLNKHNNVHERLQSDGSSYEDDGKHWEYFQQQNKLLNLAVSKLCRQEGIDVADLVANGTDYQWKIRRNLFEN